MRYISNAQIKEGMALALPFYGPNFEVMLGEGMTLTASHIKRLKESGYQGVYIKDELSKSLKPVDVVPPGLRVSTIKAAKDILVQAEKGAGVPVKISREQQNRMIMPVIEAIIANRRRIVDMFDLKPFDDYMYYHTANVVILSLLVGIEMGISGVQLYELGMASFMHDVGNMFIPKSVLNKPGSLMPDEFEIVKAHSEMGFEYLRDHFDISIEACMGALQHHENFDGTGYPSGLKKDRISIYGRIIAVTDVYDALTSRRPFRQPVYPASAMDYMIAGSGTMFDPAIIKSLQRVVALYPLGCLVELDNGAIGIVVENFPKDLSRPKVRLIDESAPYDIILNLCEDHFCSGISVSEIIDWQY